jgi:hypothetical protein
MRFDWNAYPGTKEFIDGSGLISVADTEEFRVMYNEACRIYRQEGGQDELGKMNVKVYNFVDNLISRIAFKISDLERSKIHCVALPLPSSNPMKNLGSPRGPIAWRVQFYPLIHLQFHNSGLFFLAKKLISNLSNAASSIYKTNASISWAPWRKLVESSKL